MELFIFSEKKKIHLHRLESFLSMKEEGRQRNSTIEIIQNNPRIEISEIRNYPSIDKYLTERIEPKHNIIIQGVSYFQ